MTRDLDFDAQAWAELTGIAAGWIQPDGMTYRISCRHCELHIQRALTQELCQKAQGRPIENDLEATVAAEFTEAANRYGCPHWRKYQVYRATPSLQRGASAIALIKMVKALGGTNADALLITEGLLDEHKDRSV